MLFFLDLLLSNDWASAISEMNLCAIQTFAFGNSYKWISCLLYVALNMVMSISTNWLDFQNICVFPLVDGDNVCRVCRVHFDDKNKNARKKWRSWSQCTVCQSWSHTACGFKKNMCLHCQCQNTMQTPWTYAIYCIPKCLLLLWVVFTVLTAPNPSLQIHTHSHNKYIHTCTF